MAGELDNPRPQWVRDLSRTVRAIALALAVGFLFWLFFIYQPPQPQHYPGRKPVVFWHMWTANWEQVVGDICNRFNKSQDEYEVIPLTVVGGTRKTLIATAGGAPPDVMAQWDAVIPAWADRGALTALDTLMTADEWQALQKRLYPAVRAIGMYKGHFYGLSVGMNIFAMYYRPGHFREAGLDPDHFPQTIAELETAADKLFQYDAQKRLSRIGLIPRQLQHWYTVYGGSLYDAATERVTLTNPRNLAALEWMTARVQKTGFQHVQQFESGLSSTFGPTWPFLNDAYAMALDGQWRVTQIAQYAPDLDYRTAPIPAPDGGKELACFSNGNFMLIPTGARNREGAWAFIRFWSGLDHPERAAEFYTWGGWLPIVPEIAQAPIYQAYCAKYPQFRTFVKILESPNVQVAPPTPAQAYLMARLGWAEDAALRGALSPKAALEQAQRDVDRELENLRAGRPAATSNDE
jgi:multiple sugar transport system substrate-binding protein